MMKRKIVSNNGKSTFIKHAGCSLNVNRKSMVYLKRGAPSAPGILKLRVKCVHSIFGTLELKMKCS